MTGLPILVEDAERAVAGIDERGRSLDDPLQRRAEVEVGTDCDDSIEQLPEARGAGEPRCTLF